MAKREVGLVAAAVAAMSMAWIPCDAAPVGAALDRPSVIALQSSNAVLLAAARAGKRLVTVGERGLILLSDDEGQQWRQAPAPVSVTLASVHFADAQSGFVVGHGGVVLVTRDAGLTWTKVLDGRRISQIYLDAAMSSGDAAAIKNAERLVADGPDKPLLDILVTSPDSALVVGAYGLALRTVDGGRTWSPYGARLDNPKGLHFYAVRQQGERVAIAGEQGLLLLSEDSGQTFRRLPTPYKGSFFTLELPGSEIVVAGLRGNIWRSRDGGSTWDQLSSPMQVSVVHSAVATDGTLFLANQAGHVLTLRGDKAVPVLQSPTGPLNALLPLSQTTLLGLGMHGPSVLSTVARRPGTGAGE